jgi:hypothetical protein
MRKIANLGVNAYLGLRAVGVKHDTAVVCAVLVALVLS